MSNYYLQDMAAAYIKAAEFTDGDWEEMQDTPFHKQLEKNARFTSAFKKESYIACCDFENAANDLGIDIRQYPAEQIGHDLWLTSNLYETSFGDRPEVYGAKKDLLTALAKAQGSHDVEFTWL